MRAGEKLISSGASVNHSLQWSDGFYVQFKEKTNMIIERKLTVFPALCTTNVLCIYAVLHLACTNIYWWFWQGFARFYCRSTPCPNVKHSDEWGDPAACENGDSCAYCHTRTEQQFHPEVRQNFLIYETSCPASYFSGEVVLKKEGCHVSVSFLCQI